MVFQLLPSSRTQHRLYSKARVEQPHTTNFNHSQLSSYRRSKYLHQRLYSCPLGFDSSALGYLCKIFAKLPHWLLAYLILFRQHCRFLYNGGIIAFYIEIDGRVGNASVINLRMNTARIFTFQ